MMYCMCSITYFVYTVFGDIVRVCTIRKVSCTCDTIRKQLQFSHFLQQSIYQSHLWTCKPNVKRISTLSLFLFSLLCVFVMHSNMAISCYTIVYTITEWYQCFLFASEEYRYNYTRYYFYQSCGQLPSAITHISQ